MGKTNAFLAPCSVLFVCLFILEEDEDEERKTLVASHWKRKETHRVLFVVVKDCGVSFAPSLISLHSLHGVRVATDGGIFLLL